MKAQELVIAQTKDALRLLMKAAAAMPEDKLAWAPLDEGRTALDQIAECLQAARWFKRVVEERSASFFGPKFMVEQKALRADYTSLAQLEAEIGPAYEELCEAIRAIPEDDLALELELAPGWNATLLDVSWYPMRNLYYHFGQINYIQTLYGDHKMH